MKTFIRIWQPQDTPALTRLVRENTAAIAPALPFTERQVEHTLLIGGRLWEDHDPEAHATPAITWCAYAGGALGAAAQCVYEPGASARFNWIVAHPDSGGALESLLATAASFCTAQGCTALGTGRWAFGAGWLGLWAGNLAVNRALEAAGYLVTRRWLLLLGETQPVPFFPPPPRIRFHVHADLVHHEWTLSALADEAILTSKPGFTSETTEIFGEAQIWGMPRAYKGDEEAKTWRSLEWIGVPTPYQRRGIGRSLLAEAMRVQATFGVSHLMAWIEPDNTPAQHLFRALGFEGVGETWEWERPL